MAVAIFVLCYLQHSGTTSHRIINKGNITGATLVEHELLILPGQVSSPLVFIMVRVALSFLCSFSFWPFPFGRCMLSTLHFTAADCLFGIFKRF